MLENSRYNLIMMMLAMLLSTAICLAPVGAQDKVYTAAENPNKVIGHLTWSIADQTKSEVAKGDKPILLKDISIRVDKDGFQTKEIALGDHFKIEFPIVPFPDKASAKGFAINGRRDDLETSGWEWFQVRFGEARKLQEGGTLGIKLAQIGPKVEIIETSFDTDVVLRLESDEDKRRKWRLKILKGSEITWPSLVDGKVRPN